MKRIDAVIRRERFEAVQRALDAVDVPGMMVFTFHGHGRQRGLTETHAGKKFKIKLLPKALVTIFVNDGDAERIVSVIARHAKTGKIGDGKIFLSPVDTAVRIRTGEKGAAAI